MVKTKDINRLGVQRYVFQICGQEKNYDANLCKRDGQIQECKNIEDNTILIKSKLGYNRSPKVVEGKMMSN